MLSKAKLSPNLCDLTEEKLSTRHKELLQVIGLDLKKGVNEYQTIAREKAPLIKTFAEKEKQLYSLPPITVLFLAYENFLHTQAQKKQKTFQDKYTRQDFLNCIADLMQAGADPNAVCEFGLVPPKKDFIRPINRFFPDDRSPIYCALTIEEHERAYDKAWQDAKQETKDEFSQSRPTYLWQLFYASPDIDVNALFYDNECQCNVSLLAYLVGYNVNGEIFEYSERYIKLLLKHPHLKLDPYCGFNLINKLVDQHQHDLIHSLLEHGTSINRDKGLIGGDIFENPLDNNEEKLAKKYAKSFRCLFTAPERINFGLLRENNTLLESILEVGKPWHELLQAMKMELAVHALQEIRKSNKKDKNFVENTVKQLSGLADKKNSISANIKTITKTLKKNLTLYKAAVNWNEELVEFTLQTLQNFPRELLESVNESWIDNIGEKTPSDIKFLFQCWVNIGKASDNTIKKAIQTGQSLAVIHLLLAQVTIQDYNALFEFAMDLKNYKDATKRYAVIRLMLQTPHCKRVTKPNENESREHYYSLMHLVSRSCDKLEVDDPTYRILIRWFSTNTGPLVIELEKNKSTKKNDNAINDINSWKHAASAYLKENYFKQRKMVFDSSWEILLNTMRKQKISYEFAANPNFKTLPFEKLAELHHSDYWMLADYCFESAEKLLQEDKQAIDKSLALNQPKVDYPVAFQICEKQEINYSQAFVRLIRTQEIMSRKRKEFPEIKETGLQFIKMARINKSCGRLAAGKLKQPGYERFYAFEMSALKCCIKYGENFANPIDIDVLEKVSLLKIKPIEIKKASDLADVKDAPPVETKIEIRHETLESSSGSTDSNSSDQPPNKKRKKPARKQELKEDDVEHRNYPLLLTNIVNTIESKLKQIEDKSSLGFKETFARNLATIKKAGNGKVFNKWFDDDLQETAHCKNVQRMLLIDEKLMSGLVEYKSILASDNQSAIHAAVEKETINQWNNQREDHINLVLKTEYSKILPLIIEYSREPVLLESLDNTLNQLKNYQTLLEEDAALVLRIKPKTDTPIQNIPRLLGKKALRAQAAREEKEAAKQRKQEAARIKSVEFKTAQAKSKLEKVSVKLETKSVEVKAKPVPELKHKKSGFHDNIWLDHALRHLLAIKHILASEIEDKDVKRYALVYNIFRCFQALIIYQAKGNDLTPQLNEGLIKDLRNMIRHRGAYLASYDEALKTAVELDHLLSKDLLELRKPYLMDCALTQDQVNKLVSACKLTSDPLFEINPFWITVNNTDLYKILATYHASLKNNNQTSESIDLQIATIIPAIISTYKQIQKNYLVAPLPKEMEAFNFTYMPNVHALKMLFAICGDLCQVDHCEKELENKSISNELKAFYQFQLKCVADGNKIAHEFHNEGGDISINRVFVLCMDAKTLKLEIIMKKINSRINLKKILNKGFTVFEVSNDSDNNQSHDHNPDRGHRMC